MGRLIPYFPLSIVVLPGERTRLHVFEPRYKQLIMECTERGMSFGIPFVTQSKFADLGTEVLVRRVLNRQENGEMDIEVEGIGLFRVKNLRNPLPEKLYSGGEVEDVRFNSEVRSAEVLEVFRWFCASMERTFPEDEIQTLYEVADALDLDQLQKYRLISIRNPKAIAAFLVNQMRLMVSVTKQETILEDRFFLN
jgi:Lon protease-like protein